MENWNGRNRPNENNFLTFLNKLRTSGILDEKRKGQIVLADDQFINL